MARDRGEIGITHVFGSIGRRTARILFQGRLQLAALLGAEEIVYPIENESDLACAALVGESPSDGFATARFLMRDGIVESELEAAVGRVRCGLNAIFKIDPADSLPLAIALQAAEPL